MPNTSSQSHLQPNTYRLTGFTHEQTKPVRLDVGLLEGRLAAIPGVDAVRDLHVWTVTSGLDAMSCHLTVSDISQARTILEAANTAMRDEFKLDHTTIQVDDAALRAKEAELRI